MVNVYLLGAQIFGAITISWNIFISCHHLTQAVTMLTARSLNIYYHGQCC